MYGMYHWITHKYQFSLYGIFDIHIVVLSQSVFQSSQPYKSMSPEIFNSRESWSVYNSNWCLIRRMGRILPEDIIYGNGMSFNSHTDQIHEVKKATSHTGENQMIAEPKESWHGIF